MILRWCELMTAKQQYFKHWNFVHSIHTLHCVIKQTKLWRAKRESNFFLVFVFIFKLIEFIGKTAHGKRNCWSSTSDVGFISFCDRMQFGTFNETTANGRVRKDLAIDKKETQQLKKKFSNHRIVFNTLEINTHTHTHVSKFKWQKFFVFIEIIHISQTVN